MGKSIDCPVCQAKINPETGEAYLKKDSDGHTFEKLKFENEQLKLKLSELEKQIEKSKEVVDDDDDGFF